ncbi:hypothetical protein JW826_02715 [Candidatus Woesearchaeota archaeon]|nr:hypothetical protein [Candidatus Woesearchaeota archaeon]
MELEKLKRLLNSLGEADLTVMKKDLETGDLARMIEERLRSQQERNINKVCPVCHGETTEDSLTLIFGPAGLKKRASFCATDCLEYFISNLKKQKQESYARRPEDEH